MEMAIILMYICRYRLVQMPTKQYYLLLQHWEQIVWKKKLTKNVLQLLLQQHNIFKTTYIKDFKNVESPKLFIPCTTDHKDETKSAGNLQNRTAIQAERN